MSYLSWQRLEKSAMRVTGPFLMLVVIFLIVVGAVTSDPRGNQVPHEQYLNMSVRDPGVHWMGPVNEVEEDDDLSFIVTTQSPEHFRLYSVISIRDGSITYITVPRLFFYREVGLCLTEVGVALEPSNFVLSGIQYEHGQQMVCEPSLEWGFDFILFRPRCQGSWEEEALPSSLSTVWRKVSFVWEDRLL